MSCWNKEQLEQMLEDVVNELDLSDSAIAENGPLGTPPAQLVRLVLDQKDATIRMLKAGFVDVSQQGAEEGRAEACACKSEARDQCMFWNGEGGCIHPPTLS